MPSTFYKNKPRIVHAIQYKGTFEPLPVGVKLGNIQKGYSEAYVITEQGLRSLSINDWIIYDGFEISEALTDFNFQKRYEAINEMAEYKVERVDLFQPQRTDEFFYYKENGVIFLNIPGAGLANLANHHIIECKDGSISVEPSILISDSTKRAHGYLTQGLWKYCK
jgi:hypothetical protein